MKRYAGTLSSEEKETLPFSKLAPLAAGMLFGLCMRLLFAQHLVAVNDVMQSSFVILVPMAVGAITVYVAERVKRRSWGYYLWAPFVANAMFVLGTLVLLIEGMICAIVIIPVFSLVGCLGGLLMGIICRVTNWPRHAVIGFAVLPFLVSPIEAQFPVPDKNIRIERALVIEAPPEAVWRAINNASEIQPEEVASGWAYRIGVPTPSAGISELHEGTLIRRIQMRKAVHFDQICADWQANRSMRCTYKFYADSFPAGSLDEHVLIGGRYFDIKDTVYTLRPIENGTELRIAMGFRVSTSFNWYALPVARLLCGNFEETILALYRSRALQSSSPPTGDTL